MTPEELAELFTLEQLEAELKRRSAQNRRSLHDYVGLIPIKNKIKGEKNGKWKQWYRF